MRIAVVHNLKRGGAWRRLSAQMSELSQHELVEIVPATGAPISAGAYVVPFNLIASSAPRPARPVLRYADLAAVVGGYRRLTRRVESSGADVVWLNPCQFLQAPYVLTALSSVYYCDEPRRQDYEDAAKASTNPTTRALYAPMRTWERSLDRQVVASVDRIVTNSAFSARRIEGAYGRSADVVYCGVISDFAAYKSETVEPAHVLTVGTLIPSKGHDLVIEAVAVSDVQFGVVVVSPRENADEMARLRSLGRRLGVAVSFRCGISDAELQGLYRAAFATLYLARDEPFGLVSIEAQAAGCPVIVADEGGLPETVVDGRTGWVVPRGAKAAAARLDDLLDIDTRTAMSAAGSASASRWSWARSAQELEAHFTSMLA